MRTGRKLHKMLAKVITECLQKLVYGLSIADKSGDLGWTLAYF